MKPRFRPRKSHWTDAEFSQAQAVRGRMSGVARRARTAERDRKIRYWYRRGMSARDVGRRFGISHAQIIRIAGPRRDNCPGRKRLYSRPFICHPDAVREPGMYAGNTHRVGAYPDWSASISSGDPVTGEDRRAVFRALLARNAAPPDQNGISASAISDCSRSSSSESLMHCVISW